MISCTEFIPAYNELFAFLERKGGYQEVATFWAYLSDHYLTGLRDRAASQGLKGCYEYWSGSLNEEAAEFNMTLDDEAGIFEIDMLSCPSKGMLLGLPHLHPYHAYCEHCDVIYRRVLEPLGFCYELKVPDPARARCRLTIRRANST